MRSLASLAYAKRKTVELGRSNIEYGQADILKLNLGVLGRTFDLIESFGMLHRLADPLAGWRVLLSLLRPGGFMMIGRYSEIARAEIVKTRTFIAEQGYRRTAGDIRQCRQALIAGAKEGASLQHCRYRELHRTKRPRLCRLRSRSLHAAAIHHAIPARHSHEQPGVLGHVRASLSEYIFRHVPCWVQKTS